MKPDLLIVKLQQEILKLRRQVDVQEDQLKKQRGEINALKHAVTSLTQKLGSR